MKAFSREVGFLLQVARKKRGLTQEAIAERIGVPRATYANLESGRQRPALDVVWRAAVVLGMPLTSVVPDAVPPGPLPQPSLGIGETSTGDLAALLRTITYEGHGLTKK